VPNKCGSSPMLAIHSDKSRANCLVVMPWSRPRGPVKRNSPVFLAARPDLGVYGLACLLRQFKPDGPPGLFLAHRRAVGAVAIRRNVLDLEGDDVAASQFTADSQVE
jgi:hypothetical protein